MPQQNFLLYPTLNKYFKTQNIQISNYVLSSPEIKINELRIKLLREDLNKKLMFFQLTQPVIKSAK